MAKVRLAEPGKLLSGNIDGFVYYDFYGKQCVRLHIIPKDPRTRKQLAQRACFTAASKEWKSLNEEEKAFWRKKGRKKGMSGLNAFMSRRLKPAGTHAAPGKECKVGKPTIPPFKDGDITATDYIPVLSPFAATSMEQRSGLYEDVLRL